MVFLYIMRPSSHRSNANCFTIRVEDSVFDWLKQNANKKKWSGTFAFLIRTRPSPTGKKGVIFFFLFWTIHAPKRYPSPDHIIGHQFVWLREQANVIAFWMWKIPAQYAETGFTSKSVVCWFEAVIGSVFRTWQTTYIGMCYPLILHFLYFFSSTKSKEQWTASANRHLENVDRRSRLRVRRLRWPIFSGRG